MTIQQLFICFWDQNRGVARNCTTFTSSSRMVVSPAGKSCNPLTLGCRAAPTSSRSSIHLDRLDRRSLNIIRGTFDSLPAYTSQNGSRARDRSRPRSPNIAHSTAALPWLSPTPLSSNCTRIFPRPPGDFVFPCHNGPFAIGLANRLFETTEENVVCRHIRRPTPTPQRRDSLPICLCGTCAEKSPNTCRKNVVMYEIDCASNLLNPELLVFIFLLQPKLLRPHVNIIQMLNVSSSCKPATSMSDCPSNITIFSSCCNGYNTENTELTITMRCLPDCTTALFADACNQIGSNAK